MSYFVDTLKELTKSNKLSLKSLGEKLNIPSSTLYNLKNYDPTIEVAVKIADYFATSLDYFERLTDEASYKASPDYKLNFIENLDMKLKENHLSIAKFCKSLGFSETSYCRWRQGIVPTYGNLIAIAKYFETSIDELVGRV